MVEIMAAALTGATLGINAAPFSGTSGGPPKTGQFFIAIDPGATAPATFAGRMADLVGAIHTQDGARLPGDGRASKRRAAHQNGVAVNVATLARIRGLLRA